MNKSQQSTGQNIVFYDGTCALCHGWVKFVIERDRKGEYLFAPLQGTTFVERLSESVRQELPDTICLLTASGQVYIKSDAILCILTSFGGGWKFLAQILSYFPRAFRDSLYSFVSRVRFSVFGHKEQLCPLVPTEQKDRFLP